MLFRANATRGVIDIKLPNFFKSAKQIKFEKASEAKRKRLLIEDKKRNAINHPEG